MNRALTPAESELNANVLAGSETIGAETELIHLAQAGITSYSRRIKK